MTNLASLKTIRLWLHHPQFFTLLTTMFMGFSGMLAMVPPFQWNLWTHSGPFFAWSSQWLSVVFFVLIISQRLERWYRGSHPQPCQESESHYEKAQYSEPYTKYDLAEPMRVHFCHQIPHFSAITLCNQRNLVKKASNQWPCPADRRNMPQKMYNECNTGDNKQHRTASKSDKYTMLPIFYKPSSDPTDIQPTSNIDPIIVPNPRRTVDTKLIYRIVQSLSHEGMSCFMDRQKKHQQKDQQSTAPYHRYPWYQHFHDILYKIGKGLLRVFLALFLLPFLGSNTIDDAVSDIPLSIKDVLLWGYGLWTVIFVVVSVLMRMEGYL